MKEGDFVATTLAKARGGAHWRIRLVPESAVTRFDLPSDCFAAVKASAVQHRGWDYPHTQESKDTRFGISRSLDDGWELAVDFRSHVEAWRLLQSGQFIHYLALWEEIEPPSGGQSQGTSVLHFEGAIYTLLEIVEFARRLVARADYGSSLRFDIQLENSGQRRLVASPERFLLGHYESDLQTITVAAESVSMANLAIATPDIAAQYAIRLFDRFGFSVAEHVIKDVQDSLLHRR